MLSKLINKLKDSNRFNISIWLLIMSVFCFDLSILRYLVTGTTMFLFLNWNLFLAFIPWLISSIIIIKGVSGKKSLIVLVISWLLFFPNAPYIITDLMHLRLNSVMPIWADLVLIFSFVWTGLMYGFLSLMDMGTLMKKYLSEKYVTALSVLLLFMASFGIYLGRFLRWNSWDVVNNPFGLFQDIFNRFINPISHPRTWGVTILFGILLNMMYFSIKLLKGKNSKM